MNNEIIDVEPKEEVKPTLEIGNYVIEILSDGQIIKKNSSSK